LQSQVKSLQKDIEKIREFNEVMKERILE